MERFLPFCLYVSPSLYLSVPPSSCLLYSGARALAMILSTAVVTLVAASFE
jgi:hypothetical protein